MDPTVPICRLLGHPVLAVMLRLTAGSVLALGCLVACATPAAAEPRPAQGDTPPVPVARPQVTGPGVWVPPLDGRPVVVRAFAPPRLSWDAGHRGVDLSGAPGQAVRAAGAGVVTYAGSLAGRGVVVVTHVDGTRTTYEPVRASVRAGVTVRAGEVLGRLGAGPGHCLPAVCLHWGRLRGQTYLDPMALLGVRPVRLLPVWAAGRNADAVGPTAVTGGDSDQARVVGLARSSGPVPAGLVTAALAGGLLASRHRPRSSRGQRKRGSASANRA